jgi:RimJ/RimL family protein N-acetyltransferase
MDYARKTPDKTLETIARSLYRDGASYGFSKLDFVCFVNLLLDMALKQHEPSRSRVPVGYDADSEPDSTTDVDDAQAAPPGGLPCERGRIRLRPPVVATDLDLMNRWLEDVHGRMFMLTCSAGSFVGCADLLTGRGGKAAIIDTVDGVSIGAVAFLNHDPVQRKAELRKVIGEPSARGQGYAREATALWISYGFEVLGLRKIYLDTLETSLRNIRLNESLGFSVEGILRNELLLDGVEHDVLRMGLCRPGS